MFDKKPAPVLNEAEAQSPLWRKVKAHLEARLAMLREMNDSPKRNAEATALLRGAIKEVKNLAALDKPAPQTEADDFKD